MWEPIREFLAAAWQRRGGVRWSAYQLPGVVEGRGWGRPLWHPQLSAAYIIMGRTSDRRATRTARRRCFWGSVFSHWRNASPTVMSSGRRFPISKSTFPNSSVEADLDMRSPFRVSADNEVEKSHCQSNWRYAAKRLSAESKITRRAIRLNRR